ncbi:MAG TPA: tetratricopeptide repeat protein, partial [Tichowtungia sp.]|nr:tetratricopeptide repeat protein [Tichowtungia sp.]
MSFRRVIVRLFLAGILCGPAGQASAQTAGTGAFADISASGLLYEASQNLAAENYAAAIPYLTHYLERMEPIKEDRVEALKQSVRLKLGKIYAYIEGPFTAADYLKQYTQTLPCYQPREAWKLLALTYYESGQFELCVDAATNALSRPLPKGLPGQEEKPAYEELSKQEMAGFSARQMKRIQEEAAEAAEGSDAISQEISDEIPDAEPDYTVEELVFIHMTLAEACSKLEKWEDSIEPYQYVIENARTEDRKGYAIMQLVNSLIALERFDDAKDFIVALYNTNARYDIRVNMALMSAAAVLYEEAQYDSALMLYRMVLPRQTLVDFQIAKMDELRREAGLPRVEIQQTTNDMGRVQTVFGNKTPGMAETDTFSAGLPPKPMELIQLEEAVGVLLRLPPYEEDVLYRKGLLYARAGRPWEAVVALDYINALDPDSERGQDAFVEALLVFVDPLKKYELVDKRGRQFLNTYKAGRGPRRVAHALTGSYQKQERWEDVKKLLPLIEQFGPSEDPVALQYECELYYMQAIADVVLMNYPSALAGFERVLNEYPGSHQQENAAYWHAMAQLFLKNYEQAITEFDAYAAAWPRGSWLPSAAFHSGVCLFGLEKYDEARERFTRVIETWPDEAVYSDACAMRADLLASDGQLDKAQRDYEEAIASARLPRQATYAVFQMTSMFELEERYDDILKAVNDYLNHYGQEADVAKAAYWVGKTKLAQGLTGEAVDAYRDTILEFGDDVMQDGVDMIISELLALTRRLT